VRSRARERERKEEKVRDGAGHKKRMGGDRHVFMGPAMLSIALNFAYVQAIVKPASGIMRL